MDIGRHRPQQQGDAMMQGALQTMHVECGFGCLQDANGGNVCSHRSALTLLESFATLEVGKGSSSSRSRVQRARTAKITVRLIETPSVLSFNELAASFQRHAAG